MAAILSSTSVEDGSTWAGRKFLDFFRFWVAVLFYPGIITTSTQTHRETKIMRIIETKINENGELVQKTIEQGQYHMRILTIGCLAAIDDPDSPEFDILSGFGITW